MKDQPSSSSHIKDFRLQVPESLSTGISISHPDHQSKTKGVTLGRGLVYCPHLDPTPCIYVAFFSVNEGVFIKAIHYSTDISRLQRNNYLADIPEEWCIESGDLFRLGTLSCVAVCYSFIASKPGDEGLVCAYIDKKCSWRLFKVNSPRFLKNIQIGWGLDMKENFLI